MYVLFLLCYELISIVVGVSTTTESLTWDWEEVTDNRE